MKKTIFLIAFAFVLIFAFSFAVSADKDNETGKANVTAIVEKNMTYGQCVSENAKIKNDCYVSVKDVLASCKVNATNVQIKQCNMDYKKDLAQCKAIFKSAKKAECGKIKANWFTKARYAFA